MDEPKKRKKQKVGLIAAASTGGLVLLIVLIGVLGGDKQDKPAAVNVGSVKEPVAEKPDTPENQDPYAAFGISKRFIERALKAPATAKWPVFSAEGCRTSYDPATQLWIVTSYVDSQNSFGALIRTRYRMKLKYVGEDEWQMTDVVELE